VILLSSRSFNMFMTATFDDKRALKADTAATAAADGTTADNAEKIANTDEGFGGGAETHAAQSSAEQ
ncbi:MAG: hypothetical protein K2L51_01540, partial [Clostridiales bacterium]|nr:hypothetical protein [Clostridiales bacterium]